MDPELYFSYYQKNCVARFKIDPNYEPTVIRDPMDSRFDLEAYLNVLATEAK